MEPISAGMAALSAVRKYWRIAAFGILLFALGIMFVLKERAENQRDEARFHLNECREARKQDRQDYEDAQRKAAEQNRAEVKRIVSEQGRISSNVEADLHARLERLRRELRNKAAGSSPNRAGASPDVQGAPGADGEAGVCLTPEELLRGATNEEKHDQLITLLEQMGMIAR